MFKDVFVGGCFCLRHWGCVAFRTPSIWSICQQTVVSTSMWIVGFWIEMTIYRLREIYAFVHG